MSSSEVPRVGLLPAGLKRHLRALKQGGMRGNLSLIWLVGLLGALTICAVAFSSAYTLKEATRKDWMHQMDGLSLMLSEQAAQTLFSAETVLNLLADDVKQAHLGDEQQFRAYASAEAQHRLLRETTKANPIIDVATFVADDGRVLNFTRAYPPPAIDLSERDYFKAHRDDPTIAVYTSAPVRNKGTGKWVFYLSRRVNDGNGRMLGLVLVGVSVEVFSRLYEKMAVALGPDAAINLYRSDFTLMTRWPLVDDLVGQKNLTGASYEVIARRGLKSGVIITEAPRLPEFGPQSIRMAAPRMLERYPFIVTPVVPESVYLRNWQISLRSILLTAALSLALVMLGVWMLLKSALRTQRELDERLRAETLLRSAQEQLETRVAERTAALRHEIGERELAQQELSRVNQNIAAISHRAGKAEVANSVLHNVGNVLNSVNVSVSLLSQQLRRTPMADLPQAVALLRPPGQAQIAPHAPHAPDAQAAEVHRFLELLAGQWQDEHQLMVGETAQLRKHVDHIRDIVSRQQSLSGHSGVSELFKPADVVNDCLAIHRNQLAQHAVDVVHREEATAPWLGDRGKVTQIVLNLIVNAEEALADMPVQPRRITLHSRVDSAGALHIQVTDNGSGISAAASKQLFVYGFTTKPDGHGWGLHASALAAQEMGGSIEATSGGPGLGATFILNLPSNLA